MVYHLHNAPRCSMSELCCMHQSSRYVGREGLIGVARDFDVLMLKSSQSWVAKAGRDWSVPRMIEYLPKVLPVCRLQDPVKCRWRQDEYLYYDGDQGWQGQSNGGESEVLQQLDNLVHCLLWLEKHVSIMDGYVYAMCGYWHMCSFLYEQNWLSGDALLLVRQSKADLASAQQFLVMHAYRMHPHYRQTVNLVWLFECRVFAFCHHLP